MPVPLPPTSVCLPPSSLHVCPSVRPSTASAQLTSTGLVQLASLGLAFLILPTPVEAGCGLGKGLGAAASDSCGPTDLKFPAVQGHGGTRQWLDGKDLVQWLKSPLGPDPVFSFQLLKSSFTSPTGQIWEIGKVFQVTFEEAHSAD